MAIHIRSGWVDTPVERAALVGAHLAASATWGRAPSGLCCSAHFRGAPRPPRPQWQPQPVVLPPARVRGLPTCSYHSLLTTHHSPLTTHHSPLTTHHSPLTKVDDLLSVPTDLETRSDLAAAEIGHALAAQPAEPAARSCLELAPSTLATLRRCGPRCRCIPSKSAAFASGLRELLAPTSLLSNRTADWHAAAPARCSHVQGLQPDASGAATP